MIIDYNLIHRLQYPISDHKKNVIPSLKKIDMDKILAQWNKAKINYQPSYNYSIYLGLLNVVKKSSITVDSTGMVTSTIDFSQNDDIFKSSNLPDTLKKFVLKFDGLCELICNKVLIDDLLGKSDDKINVLKNNINVKLLDQNTIKKSHSLEVYSIFHKILALLFKIYPDNIFSTKEQWHLTKKIENGMSEVNKEILKAGLDRIEVGTTLKLGVFRQTFSEFFGHSLLIKKTGDNQFIFFDPNSGEHRDLTLDSLEKKINLQLGIWNANELFFTTGESYLKRLKSKKILDVAKKTGIGC